ncbi:MAG TPA: glycosyltransferase family 1 protein [Usitatibacter sp.]|nr:glycosyltransferase family 1 protein [Usitatibacter sp.]
MLDRRPGHHLTLYSSFGDFYFDPSMGLARPYRGRNVGYGPRHFSRNSAAAFWNSPGLEQALGNPDIVHANNFWCPAPLAQSRLVYTCYDLGFTVDPGWTTEANRVGCFQGMFRAAVAADWIVAISEATREHFLRTFPHFSAERVRVIHPTSRFTDLSAQGRRPRGLDMLEQGNFLLSVGTIEPRKNHLGLARAYARYLALGGKPRPVVFAGGRGWLMGEFARELSKLGISGHVAMTGYLPDDEIAWLYRNCLAHLYPSFFEGFGLPVLEGMQFGAPTICSNTTALPEVAGEATILLAPEDTEAWAQAMLALSNDAPKRQWMAAAGRARAAQFNRQASAAAMVSLYEEAAAAPKRVAHQIAA